MKYVFYIQERTILVDEKLMNKENNKTIKYKLKHYGSGISIIVNVKYLKNETDYERMEDIKNKLKIFINSDSIEIKDEYTNDISII